MDKLEIGMRTERIIPPWISDKPGVVMPEEKIVKDCLDCGKGFETSSRVQERCTRCGNIRKRKNAAKASRKLRAKKRGAA